MPTEKVQKHLLLVGLADYSLLWYLPCQHGMCSGHLVRYSVATAFFFIFIIITIMTIDKAPMYGEPNPCQTHSNPNLQNNPKSRCDHPHFTNEGVSQRDFVTCLWSHDMQYWNLNFTLHMTDSKTPCLPSKP